MTALLTDLKRLGSTKAPDGFAERVLVEVGMAKNLDRQDVLKSDAITVVLWRFAGDNVSICALRRSRTHYADDQYTEQKRNS